MTLTSGTKLGPYEVVSPAGAGGMGEVYRAIDTRLDRTVAIKILPAHLSSNPEAKQRFEREARAISSLNHPNICTLYDVGHQDGTDYLVMEFLEGETLADRLVKGPLPPDQVLAQSPAANASQVAAPKISLLLTATADPEVFTMPSFLGQPLGSASRTLQDAGFKLGTVSMAPPPQENAEIPGVPPAVPTVPSEPSPASVIVTQWPPAGQKVLAGAVVNFEVR